MAILGNLLQASNIPKWTQFELQRDLTDRLVTALSLDIKYPNMAFRMAEYYKYLIL
jgi:hypothetical protein